MQVPFKSIIMFSLLLHHNLKEFEKILCKIILEWKSDQIKLKKWQKRKSFNVKIKKKTIKLTGHDMFKVMHIRIESKTKAKPEKIKETYSKK